jgi:hypothetical protein
MPRVRVDKLGSIGITGDAVNSLLPPQAWNKLRDVVTANGSLRSAPGERKLFNLSVAPIYHTAYIDPSQRWKLVVSDGLKVFVYDILDQTELEITPVPATPWTGGFVTFADLNGVLVINSESNGAFYWDSNATPPNNILKPLPGWDADWRCREMVAYRYFLVALGMTEATIELPHKLRWSGSASEGELPTEWVPSLTNDAGDDLLGETSGIIVGGRVVRDYLYIVKEDAIYSLSWVGGEYVMRTDRLKGGIGTRLQRGFSEIQGALAIFTSTDILVFDGQNSKSLIANRVKEAIFSTVSETDWELSRVYVHRPSSTLWIGIVAAGYRSLSDALIYNWDTDTWSHKSLKYGYGFDTANVTLSGNLPTWDELGPVSPFHEANPRMDTGLTWDQQKNGSWNKGTYQPSTPDVVIYEGNAEGSAWWVSVMALNNANSDGTAKSCEALRTGIPLEGAAGVMMIREVWPEMTGSIPVGISIGGMENLEDAPYWDGPYTFDPRYDVSITPRVTGRYMAVKVESNAIGSWNLGALTFDWAKAGER